MIFLIDASCYYYFPVYSLTGLIFSLLSTIFGVAIALFCTNKIIH